MSDSGRQQHGECEHGRLWQDSCVLCLRAEVKRLQGVVDGLAARVAAQSEVLSQRAEKPSDGIQGWLPLTPQDTAWLKAALTGLRVECRQLPGAEMRVHHVHLSEYRKAIYLEARTTGKSLGDCAAVLLPATDFVVICEPGR